MENDLNAILTFVRKLYKLWVLAHWEREASKALRRKEPYNARIAFEHIEGLYKEV